MNGLKVLGVLYQSVCSSLSRALIGPLTSETVNLDFAIEQLIDAVIC